MKDLDVYKTKDLYEAAYLHASKLYLLDLEGTNNNFHFVFTPYNRAIEYKEAYWANRKLIHPQVYADSIRSLKNRIFATQSYIRGNI